MKHLPHLLARMATAVALLALPSCLDDDSLEEDDTFLGTFEACWRAIDEHYCFFDEKNVDWDEVYTRYKPYFRDSVKTMVQELRLLDSMLDLLCDGHVNIYAPFNTARYWAWYEDYPQNFDNNLLERHYLGTNYWTAAGFKYGLMPDSVGYIRYESFSVSPGETNLDYMLAALNMAKGLIIDVRDNGGGALTNVPTIASRFGEADLTYGYLKHKTGKGHNDFSTPEPIKLDSRSDGRIYWDAKTQPVVVLTNRSAYSATNIFVMAMKASDGIGGRKIKTFGDKTGGGSGMPFSTVLPNGWTLRFSACPMYDKNKKSVEGGIDPDFKVDMDSVSMTVNHKDDIIEAARTYINENTLKTYDEQE